MNTTNATTYISNIDDEEFLIRLDRLRKFKSRPSQEIDILYDDTNFTSNCVWNLDSQQDFVWQIIQDNKIYAIVADGHGNSTVVNWLRSKHDTYLYSVCNSAEPTKTLEADLENEVNTYDSGACISIIRTNMTNHIEVFWIGDTMTQVYMNGDKVAQTESHTWEVESEFHRKLDQGGVFKKEMMLTRLPEITNNPHMTMAEGFRCDHTPSDYRGCDNLQMTRCAGHCGVTGYNYGHLEVCFTPDDDIKIITASDGVWDVIHENESLAEIITASELVDFAAKRWCGNWNYVHHAEHKCKKCKCKKPDEQVISVQQGIPPDDISVSLIHLPKK